MPVPNASMTSPAAASRLPTAAAPAGRPPAAAGQPHPAAPASRPPPHHHHHHHHGPAAGPPRSHASAPPTGAAGVRPGVRHRMRMPVSRAYGPQGFVPGHDYPLHQADPYLQCFSRHFVNHRYTPALGAAPQVGHDVVCLVYLSRMQRSFLTILPCFQWVVLAMY